METNSLFSYQNLQSSSLPIIDGSTMAVTFPESRFIGLFQSLSDNFSEAESKSLNTRAGEVIYISINQEKEGNLESGWNILEKIFLSYHVNLVMLPKKETAANSQEKDGQIRIFQHLTPSLYKPETLQNFISEIEKGLVEAEILPGNQLKNTRSIQGAQYVFYQRFEENLEEVQARRKRLAQENPKLNETETFSSPFMRSSAFTLAEDRDEKKALALVQAHQTFYELDRCLPLTFAAKLDRDEDGKNITFAGNVMLAMKIANHALKTMVKDDQ